TDDRDATVTETIVLESARGSILTPVQEPPLMDGLSGDDYGPLQVVVTTSCNMPVLNPEDVSWEVVSGGALVSSGPSDPMAPLSEARIAVDCGVELATVRASLDGSEALFTVRVQVGPNCLPDLTIVTTSAIATPQRADVDVTLTNSGLQPTDGSCIEVGYAIRADGPQQPDPADFTFEAPFCDVVLDGNGGTLPRSFTATAPQPWPANPVVWVAVRYAGQEVSTDNNRSMRVLTLQSAELSVAIQGATINSNGVVSINTRVTNNGTQPIGGADTCIDVALFLTEEDTPPTDPLAFDEVFNLCTSIAHSGGTLDQNTQLTIAPPTGPRTVWAWIDPTDTVPEFDEEDNLSAPVMLTAGEDPNLVVSLEDYSSQGNGTAIAQYTVRNTGGSPVGDNETCLDVVFVVTATDSTTPTQAMFAEADGDLICATLDPGAQISGTATVAATEGVPEGTGFAWAYVDSFMAYVETDEEDNSSAPVAVTPRPLVINEVRYDDPSGDDLEFVELFGQPATPLDGLALVHINGSNDQELWRIPLDGVTLPADGYLVLGDAAVLNV
ncbi:MAG: hypothetical protein AAFS10_26515, partial [Myxococcota bacterium]